MAKQKLSERRRRFIAAYLQTLNASEAARQAGYATRANVAGQRLLTNADIRQAIDEQLNKVIGAEKAGLKRRILSELEEQAFSDATFEDSTPQGGTITKANPNKMKALELLSKYIGILTEKVEVTGKDGGPIELKWPDDPNPAT